MLITHVQINMFLLQGLSLAEVKMLGLAPLHHLGNIHLAINIASFLVKEENQMNLCHAAEI